MSQPEVIVVGAGLSGSVMAERFATQGNKTVLLLEQRTHIGGNCYDRRDKNGIVIHQYGPHLFHTNKKHVWDYLSKFTDWHTYEHKVLSNVDDQLVPIPFNLNSLECLYDSQTAEHIENLLVAKYGEGSKVPILDLKASEEPELKNLGELVYEKFFVNYTVKQWGVKPEDIAKSVTARVPVVLSRDDRYFHDLYQAIPINGYTSMIQAMLSHNNITVELGVDATSRLSFDFESGTMLFDNEPFEGQLIYTGMLDALFDFVEGELPYRSLQFKYETFNTEFFQPVTTVNYPNEEAFTRITEFKHILPVDTQKTVIVKEYPQDFDRNDPERNVPYYPVFNEKNMAAYDKYRELIAPFDNLTVLGRLADYKYYNMDDAVHRALEVFSELYEAL